MRAMQLTDIGSPLKLCDVPSPQQKNGETTVTLRYAALNRRDYWMQQGQYPGIALPVTPGSDGVGIVNGTAVLINPGLHWGISEQFQSQQFTILGMPVDGTLAEQVVVPSENVYPKPAYLSWEEAAALPLAGVTAFRALFVQGEAKPGESVLITGIGGGVALTAMQFAHACGMRVCVTSGNAQKQRRAEAMGVDCTANYQDANWAKDLQKTFGEFDLILDSAGGEGFNQLQRLVKPGGRIVVYGGTLGKISHLSPHLLYWRQMTIRGSTMGSPKDFADMLSFVEKHQIRPVVDSVFDLKDTNAALVKLRDGTQFGKVVIRISA